MGGGGWASSISSNGFLPSIISNGLKRLELAAVLVEPVLLLPLFELPEEEGGGGVFSMAVVVVVDVVIVFLEEEPKKDEGEEKGHKEALQEEVVVELKGGNAPASSSSICSLVPEGSCGNRLR